MSRFRNDSGGVLTVNDLMRQVGLNEEFDWPDHDPEVHGLIPGCAWLDAPEPEAAEGDTEGAVGEGDADTSKPPRKRGKAGQDKENAE